MANAPATTSLARRIESALKEGRLPQALELAKQHAKQEPGPAALALLQKTYLKSAEAQVARGSFRDAHALLSEAEKLPVQDAAWWERLAELRADLGDHTRAVQLLEKAPASTAKPRVLGRIADRAIREGPAGRELLPPDLKPQFDLVRKAFDDYEKSHDDAARETMHGIGLSSPFLEWKLLLRGLIAWSANDSGRALENWSRLTPERLPARIAAPFRFLADKAYAANLPANRYSVVVRQADQLSGTLTEGLRRLRKFLASEETIPQALDAARTLVPELKKAAPDLVPRLANLVYWALVGGGQPEDMPRFTRLFGPPADDPQFFRLQALVMEGMQRLERAHEFWNKYQAWIAAAPDRWPGTQGDRARALILERMGRLARDWLDNQGEEEDELEDFFAFFQRNQPRKKKARKALKPSAEECFLKASELAPDWIDPSMELLREYAGNAEKAYAAVEDVLRRFPNNLPVLESAAGFYERIGDTAKAHECIKRALAANPLDKDLRQQAAGLALNDARRQATAGEYEAAHAALKEAADLGGAELKPAVSAIAAAFEIRAGHAEAARTHQEMLMNAPGGRVAGAYQLFVELSRLKLKKKELDPYQAAFTGALQGPMNGAEVAALLHAVARYANEPVAYRGLKTHQKKVLDRVIQLGASLDEGELVQVGLTLHGYQLWKPLLPAGEAGVARSPNNAFFAFFVAEALLNRRRSDYVNYQTGAAFRRVKQLIEAATDGRYRLVQELLDRRVQRTPDLARWLDSRWEW